MRTGFHSYPTMKDSGLPWLGLVPEHWGIGRGKRLFRKVDRCVRDTDDVVTCFRDGTVTLRKKRRVRGFTEALKEIGYQGVRRGDLVIHGMDAFAGAIGVADSDGKSTPVYSVCEPEPAANARYYAYLLREMARSQWVLALAKGIRERSTDFRFASFGSQLLPRPPLAEQAAIVKFLAHSDRRIQCYIHAKKRLMALLEEQKQASIRQAITGQIDVRTGKPYPSYAESSVDWLGRVPEHWEIRRLGTSVERCINGTWGSDPNGADDLVCVRVADFDRVRWRVKLDKPTFRAVAPGERRNRLLREDDLLLEKSGGGDSQPVGVVVLYDHDIDAVCSNFVARVPVSPRCDAAYLVYLHAHLYSTRLNTRSIKQTTGIQNLDASMYFSEKVPFPPLVEQIAIARSLDEVTIRNDRARGGTRSEIDRLSEYRARLISDVVTGQLDVREAAATLSDVELLTPEDEPGPTLNADDKALVEEEGTLPGVAKQ